MEAVTAVVAPTVMVALAMAEPMVHMETAAMAAVLPVNR